MDNNCASVTFPDFTRGHWNDVKGYKHQYASAEEEAAVEASSKAWTAAWKAAGEKNNLWKLFDAMTKAETEWLKSQDINHPKGISRFSLGMPFFYAKKNYHILHTFLSLPAIPPCA